MMRIGAGKNIKKERNQHTDLALKNINPFGFKVNQNSEFRGEIREYIERACKKRRALV